MKLPGGWKNVDLDHPREVDHVERSSGFYGTADRFSVGIPRRAKLSDKCRHLRRLNGGHQIDIQCGAPDTARGRGHGPAHGITYLQAVNAAVIRLRVSLRGSNAGEFFSIDFAEQLSAQILPGGAQEDFAVAGVRIRLSKTRFSRQADGPRKLQRALQLFSRRHLARQVHENLPRVGRRIRWPHTYLIAEGGAGSLGSPAFASGILIRASAISASTTVPARYDGSLINSGNFPYL